MNAHIARRALLALLVLPLTLVLSACSGSVVADPNPVADRFGLHVTGGGSRMQVRLPQDLTGDAEWGLKQEVASRAGFDLRPFAGTTVTLVNYPIRERYGPHRLNLWLVESNGKVVGAYAAVRPESSLAPGIFSLSEIGEDSGR